MMATFDPPYDTRTPAEAELRKVLETIASGRSPWWSEAPLAREVLSRHPEPPRGPATAGLMEPSGVDPTFDGLSSEPGSPTAPVPGSTHQSPSIEERLLYHHEDQATGKMVLRNQDGPEAADTIARLRERVAELEGECKASRFVARLGEELWKDAEKEISELRIEIADLSSRALPSGEGEWVCFTRGRFNEMVKEKEATDAELSSLKAAGTRADGIEAAASFAEGRAAGLREAETVIDGWLSLFEPRTRDNSRWKYAVDAVKDIRDNIETHRALSPASPKPVVGNGEAHEAIVAAIDFLDAEHLRRRDIGPGEDEDHIAEPERIASRLHALLPSLTAAELDAKRASRFGREGG